MERLDYVCPVVGKRRSGKSTFLHGDPSNPDAPDWGAVDWSDYARAFILDPRGEWDRGLVFTSLPSFVSALRRAASGKYPPDRKRWIYRPEDGRISEWYDVLAPDLPNKDGVPGLLVLDEADQYMNTHKVEPGLSRIVQLGGNSDQSVILVTRSYKSLNVNVRSQRDLIVAFRGVRSDVIKDWTQSFDQGAGVCSGLSGHSFTVLGERRLPGWMDKVERLDNFQPTAE